MQDESQKPPENEVAEPRTDQRPIKVMIQPRNNPRPAPDLIQPPNAPNESRQEFLKKLIDRLRQQPQVPLEADGLADGLEQHLRQVVPSENATHEIPRNEASGSNDTSGRAREHQKRSKLRDELECHLREADGLICELEAIERQGRRLNQREIDRAKNPNLLRPVPIGPNRQGRLGA